MSFEIEIFDDIKFVPVIAKCTTYNVECFDRLLRRCLLPILPSAVLISKQTDWIKAIQVHSSEVTCTSPRNLNICSCKIHLFSQQQNTKHSTREVTLKYNDFRPQNHGIPIEHAKAYLYEYVFSSNSEIFSF